MEAAGGDPDRQRLIARELADKLASERLPEVRIGLAAGPVVGLRGDYYGDPVNLAARLVKLAQPGETLASGPLVEALSPERPDFEAIETPSFLKGVLGAGGGVSVAIARGAGRIAGTLTRALHRPA